MKKVKLSKRNFLKGAFYSALPLSMQLAKSAMAAESDAPCKFLFIYTPDGATPELFHPTGTGTNFTLNQMTSTLEAVKDDITFLQGINMYNGAGTHEGGIAKLLTANGPDSIDNVIGKHYLAETQFSSLRLGVASSFQGDGSMSYIDGNPLSHADNPLKEFDNIFQGQSGGTDDPTFLRKKSVVDSVLDDLSQMRSQLGAVEKSKLDVHLDSLREVEKRLQPTPVSGQCNTAGFNSGGLTLEGGGYPPPEHREDVYQRVGELQGDIALTALSCGKTRVASISWSHKVSPTTIPGVGGGQQNHNASHSNGSDSWIAIKSWYMERIADLMIKMKNMPDAAGGSLLDNTMVMHCTELGHSNRHDHNDMPFFIGGGGAGYLNPGRILRFDGESHAKIYVDMARAAGININTFNDHGPKGDGPLPGLAKS